MERSFNLMLSKTSEGYVGDIYEFPELRVHGATYAEIFSKAEKMIKIHLCELEGNYEHPDVLANYRLTVDI